MKTLIHILLSPIKALGWGLLFVLLTLLSACGGGDDDKLDAHLHPVNCQQNPRECQ